MLNPASPSQPRTRLRRVLRAMAVLAAIAALPTLYVALVGVSIDASGLRGKISGVLAQGLAREVHLDGPLQLEISAHPRLVVGGLHIANAPGYPGGEFASLGEARLELDLWELLRLRLQIEELSGSDVHVRLQMHKDGKPNWVFGSSSRKQAPATPAAEGSADQGLAALLAVLDIRRISLEEVEVDFTGASGGRHFFELKSLIARLPAGEPLTLSLDGRVEKKYPYALEFTGGTIGDLARLDKPWPFEMTLGFMNSRLALSGQLSNTDGVINFGLGTGDLKEFERLLQTRLPDVGAAGLSGKVTYGSGTVALDGLNGVLGKTTFNGALHFDSRGDRPSLRGDLALPVLDLGPFVTGHPTTQDAPSKSLAQLYQELARATFSLKDLNAADADLTLHVGKWLGLPGDVHDAALNLKLKHGGFSMPMRVTAGDVVLSGAASVDASKATIPRFRLALGTRNSAAGRLAGLLVGAPDVSGQLGRLDFIITARGDSGAELMQSLDLKLEVEHGKLAYGNRPGVSPVQFALDDLVLALPAGKELRGDAHGSLLEKPFAATLRGGSLTAIMQQAHVPIDFELHAGSAAARVHAMLDPPTQNSGSETVFELVAPHSGEIASWLGLKPGADAPVDIRGTFHAVSGGWHLPDFSVRLGHSALSADVQRTQGNGKPLTRLQLTGELLDLAELQSLLPEPDKNAPPAAAKPATSLIDVPILPQGISLADADIAVRIKRIVSALPVSDVRFDGRIRDGVMTPSPFGATVDETAFDGSVMLDLRAQDPHAVLSLNSGAMDIGRVLDKLGIARNLDAGIEHLHLKLDMHSSRLGEMLAQSELAVEFEGGHLALHQAKGGAGTRVAIQNGALRSHPGQAVYLELVGALGDAPVAINLQTATAADLVNPSRPIPFQLVASASGAAIQLSGSIERPFGKQDVELQLDMAGSRLDNLNALARASLPPWGPWSVSGKFRMSSGGYEVSGLVLRVGTSELTGHGQADTRATPPRIEVALTAPSIQLDDFRWGDWSPEKAKPAQGAEAKAGNRAATQAGKSDARKILSAEVLRRLNAYLIVSVNQVLSGNDTLGDAHLKARLEDGHAEIGPVVVHTSGGPASFKLDYEPGEKDVAVSLRTEAKRLDYGILARRIDPKSELQGILTLDVDVSAHAQSLSEILENGKGHIDFAIWPQNLKSGLLDFWAVDVLVALLPAVDKSNESKVNCAIGRFVLKNGKLSEKTILIDTSRMRVTGKGGADFAARNVGLYLRPRSKTPQFLSVAIPIDVTGDFTHFHVGVRPLDLVETAGQFATSVLWVPIESLLGKSIPADGSDVCLDTALQ